MTVSAVLDSAALTGDSAVGSAMRDTREART